MLVNYSSKLIIKLELNFPGRDFEQSHLKHIIN